MEVQVNTSPLLQPTHLPERAERGKGSCVAERMEWEVFFSIPPTGGESSKIPTTGWLSALKAWIRPLSLGFNLICIIVITILIVLITRPAKTREPCTTGAPCPLAACPYDWIGFRGKCYYFSQLEANWNESQKNCSALGASLAGIDTQQEMVSDLRRSRMCLSERQCGHQFNLREQSMLDLQQTCPQTRRQNGVTLAWMKWPG